MNGLPARGPGSTSRVFSLLQTSRGSCLLSLRCFLRWTSPGRKSWQRWTRCPMLSKLPYNLVGALTAWKPTDKKMCVCGDRQRRTTPQPCCFILHRSAGDFSAQQCSSWKNTEVPGRLPWVQESHLPQVHNKLCLLHIIKTHFEHIKSFFVYHTFYFICIDYFWY